MDVQRTEPPVDTSAEAWKLNEAGLSIFPLGSPQETPPRWFVDGRCNGDLNKAKKDWPKSPRFRWKQYQDKAPADEDIEQWTTQWPYTNWAIVTGAQIVVVDADSQEAVAFIEKGGITRTPLRVRTSKGKHYYFQAKPDYPIRNSVRKSKIDIRGAGGYVVAPGSIHADGNHYQWETDEGVELDDILDLPVLTPNDVAAINGFNGSPNENEPEIGNLGFIASQYAVPHDGKNLMEGEGRNNATASLAGQLIRQGSSLHEIKKLLDRWNTGNTPPLSDTELNTTIASIARTHLNNHPGSELPIIPETVPARSFEFSHINELMTGVKPISWLVKGFFEMDSLSMMFGAPGCGKSFVAIDLACCVATGQSWHGKQVKLPGSVFYIAGEGFNGLSRRLLAWQQTNGYNLRNIPLYVSKCSASLSDSMNARMVSECIEQQIISSGGIAPSMIVIDTLARNFGAGDENATKEMNIFVNNIDQYLRRKFQCCVLIVHHTGVGNSQRARGSGALKGALDAEYAVVKDDDVVKVSTKKMKDADEPEDMHFLFEPVRLPFTDEDGEQQVSCVMKFFDKKAIGQLKAAEAGKKQAEVNLGNKQKNIIRMLQRLTEDAKVVLTKSGRDPELALIEVKGLRQSCLDAKIICKKNWSRSFNALLDREFLKIDPPFVSVTDKAIEVTLDD